MSSFSDLISISGKRLRIPLLILSLFLDAFASKDTVKKENSLDLRINSILIRRGRMSYHVLSEEETPGKFNAKHIQLQNIIANISLKALSKDSLNLGIKRLSLDEKASGFSLKKMSLKLVANNKQTNIDNFTIELPETSLKLDTIHLEYDSLKALTVLQNRCISLSVLCHRKLL